MGFLDRWAEVVKSKYQLRIEQFLNARVLHPALVHAFVDASRDMKPLPGFGWRSIARSTAVTPEKLKALEDGSKKFEFSEYMEDQCFWFPDKTEKKQRELFLGHGGLTILYMKPDPKTEPPAMHPIVSKFASSSALKELTASFDIERITGIAYAFRDSFLPKSKEMFLAIDPSDARIQKAPFIVPLLNSRDFFGRPAEECDAWFQLFDMYVTESPEDRGILLAAKPDIEEDLIAVLREMEDAGLQYSE